MSKLSRNIIANLSGQGLILILGFVAVKYVFKRLGEDALGIIYFTQTLSVMFCALLEMGIGSTTVREVSAHLRDEPKYIHDFIRTGSLLFWSAYGLLAVAIYTATPLLVGKWINLKSLDPATATHVLRVLATASVLALPKSFYLSVLRGLQRMELNNLIDVTISALQQFGSIVVLILGGKLIHVAWWLAVVFAVSILAYLWICARFVFWQALLPGFSSSVVRRNLGFASRMASLTFLGMVQNQADKAVVSKLLPLGAFGYYAMAYATASKGALVTVAIAQAALPSLSELFKAGNQAALVSQYRKLHDLLCFATVPIYAAFPFSALPLFGYVLNAQAARMLLLPITFLCLGFYMNGTLSAPYVLSVAVGRPDITARTNFYALFVALPVTVLLIKFFGLSGAGFSWVSYNLFAYTYQAPRICIECLHLSPWQWYLHVMKFMGLGGLVYGAAWMIRGFYGVDSIAGLVLSYAVATTLFLPLAYLLIGNELRMPIKQLAFPGKRG